MLKNIKDFLKIISGTAIIFVIFLFAVPVLYAAWFISHFILLLFVVMIFFIVLIGVIFNKVCDVGIFTK